MKGVTKTNTATKDRPPFGISDPLPALVVAYAPPDSVTVDRCMVKPPFVVGRGPYCDLIIKEERLSKNHFKIVKNVEGYGIEDLGSTNGTYLDGERLLGKQRLPESAVIRAGQTVFVFHRDAHRIFDNVVTDPLGFVGRFHLGEIILELEEAALSERHLLLAGPSGAGKEHAARAVSRLLGFDAHPLKLVTHNAARFSSEEEAAATLFGVGARVFSSVDDRIGLIESAEGGILFLDEIHNLPGRVQRSLLRIIEEGRTARIGETTLHDCNVRFVLAVNAPAPTYGLTPDLLARLRLVRIPALSERRADIPTIFNHLLGLALNRQQVDSSRVLSILKGDHYESLCLDGFRENNVRGLIDIADRVATGIKAGAEPNEAVMRVFGRRFSNGPVTLRYAAEARHGRDDKNSSHENAASRGSIKQTSTYETYKHHIIAAYDECEHNLSQLERLLRARGIRCSRRWLAVFLDKWGVRSL